MSGVLIPLTCISCLQEKTDSVIIAAAANMQFPLEKLTEVFTKQTHIKCQIITGSSGKLTAQIIEGAPYDIFISANNMYPNQIHLKGLTQYPPKIFGYGKLVLWTMKNELKPSLDALTNHQIQHIAIANPKTAPYGQAAIEVLEHYQLLDTIKTKLIYGESVAQTNQFIHLQSADIGFTAKSAIYAPTLKSKGHWVEIPDRMHRPIAQTAVLLNHQNTRSNARRFYNFLFSDKAIEILEDFGYLVPQKK